MGGSLRTCLVLLGLVGCAHPQASMPPCGPLQPMTAAPLVADQEEWTWSISLGGISAGQARLAFSRQGAGHRVIVGNMGSNATGVAATFFSAADQIIDTFAAGDGHPIASDELSSYQGRHVHIRTAFSSGTVQLTIGDGAASWQANHSLGPSPPTYNLLGPCSSCAAGAASPASGRCSSP
jgi:hypothetical protein